MGELRCSGRVGSSCSTCGTYPWSFVTRILRNGYRIDDYSMTTRNPWFSSFLVSSKPLSRKSSCTTSSGISDQLREIYSLFKCCWKVATYLYINEKFTMGKLKLFLCRWVSFLTDPHSQFRRWMSKYEAYLHVVVYVVFVISRLMGCMGSIKSPNLELSWRDIIYIA
jgi:hypothetical protein